MRYLKTVASLAALCSFLSLPALAAKVPAKVAAKSSAKSSDGIIIANSSPADAAAKQIVRNVANETLKTISTKDSSLPENVFETAQGVPVVEPLEDAELSLPAKVVSEPAPGLRNPAAERVEAPTAPPIVESASVPPEKAVQWLQNGNKRYLKKANRTDGKSQVDRDRLNKGQHPHAIVLSCSDSRVPPETVFDQSLGELFVVRTAGESLDSAVIASLEYAVEHLGPRLLVVMGHTSCGAIQTAIAAGAGEGSSAGSPALDHLVADIKPRLPARAPSAVASEGLQVESTANAKGVAADLLKRSSIIRARVEKGDLVIKPAMYHLDSGSVEFY